MKVLFMKINKATKSKYIVIAATLFVAALITTQAFQPEEHFTPVEMVQLKSVKDWPPVSSSSPMYSGSEYTQHGARSFFQYISPKGLVALDTNGNRYFIPGHESVNEQQYSLEISNRNRLRFCDHKTCIVITERISQS